MPTTGSDISVVLSGGSGNLNPNQSLGGNPSATPVTDNTLNNLFDDVLATEVDVGHEDYRCLYIFNDGENVIYSPKLWIADDFSEGSVLEMGIESRDELQRITITGAIPTGGSMTLTYNSVALVSNANVDLGIWATQLEAQLNALSLSGDPLLQEVEVTAQIVASDTVIFDILMTGIDGKTSQPVLTLDTNALTPAVAISITTPQSGSPINTIAPTINVETTPPGGVGFSVPTETSPISLPKMRPGDGFPFWIKRVTSPGIDAVANDGFKIMFLAEALEPVS